MAFSWFSHDVALINKVKLDENSEHLFNFTLANLYTDTMTFNNNLQNKDFFEQQSYLLIYTIK